MTKQKISSDFKNKILTIRLILTAVLAVVFLLVFFFCGGALLLFNKMGDVKCFAKNDFEIHYLDVGQGDCTFIRFPDNTTMLIDAGVSSSGEKICNYLKDLFTQEGLEDIDYFLLTHQDSDHVGGASEVFEKFQVNCVFRPMVYSTSEVDMYENLEDYTISNGIYYDRAIISAYNEPNCIIRYSMAGISWGNDSYSVRFLSPNSTKYSSSNAYSPVVKITYRERSFLFTGDAESKTENEVIEKCPELLKADVLKVAHHGSKTSTSAKFLSYVQPKMAIISVGRNSYGHPADETLTRLQEINCKIYQTISLNDIALSVDSKGIIVIGGENNAPIIDVTMIIAVFIVGILVVWGIQPRKKQVKSVKKRQSKKTKATMNTDRF